MFSFYAPENQKNLVFWCFQGVFKMEALVIISLKLTKIDVLKFFK